MEGNLVMHRLTHSSSFAKASVAASVAAIVGAILAFKNAKFIDQLYLQWPSSGQRINLEESWVVPGLQNLGNNCFLNVVLQALSSCSSFLKFLGNAKDEFECTSDGESTEDLPLTVALASLVKELSILRLYRTVLNPREMMLAMTYYLPKFNLTSQQDAEEAFIHLLSSLREELSDSYLPDQTTLADVPTLPDCRILSAKTDVRKSEHERWQRTVLGPFNGILGSALTCQTCSFQISLDYQLFNSLHLSPIVTGGNNIIISGSLLDVLKRFFAVEKLENYFCNHCWHVAAIKYLLLSPGNEGDVKKLKICQEEETCECRNISSLGSFPWLKNLSRTFKQLHIARSPKILCLHLQRASVNMFGEMVKLEGHVSFPLVLDLAPLHMDHNRYHLVSVVEHYGRVGHGHYTVYRKVTGKPSYEYPEGLLESTFTQWFCISDSEVYRVSEEEVLNAEASLLFYEKISC